MSTIMRTARVVLREFTPADLEVLAAMMADEDQMRLYPRPRTKEETNAWLERTIDLYQSRASVSGSSNPFSVPSSSGTAALDLV